MIKSSKDLTKDIRKFWNIRDIWLFDPKYFILDIKTVSKIIEGLIRSEKSHNNGNRYQYKDNVWDCDDYSRNLANEFRKYHRLCIECSKPNKKQFPWAFGICLARMLKGNYINHSVNIAVCKENIYLIEPQNGEIWEADPIKDKLYYIQI